MRGIDMPDKIRALGICLGASTVSVVQVEAPRPSAACMTDLAETIKSARIRAHHLYPHEGAPRQTLLAALKEIDIGRFERIAVTGRTFRHFVNLSAIPEPEAVEYAYGYARPAGVSCPAVVSAGGETFMVYTLNAAGEISNVITGNKCASGTGEFFLQQLRRMNVSLEAAAKWAAAEEPYRVSGRCSVFCKSDCTHATNKGVPKARVTAGLCRMMANKVLELLKKVPRRHIMLTGGTARNHMMVAYLQKEIEDLIVPPQAAYFEALGAGLWALAHETDPFPGRENLFKSDFSSFARLAALKNFSDQVDFKTVKREEIHIGDTCLLGLDVGSTTTKAVLLRKSDNAILASVYLRTSGDPVGASRRCYRQILEDIRQHVNPADIRIIGLGVCGSGRQIAGLHALTDGIINEIIAHAAAAVFFDAGVDTIFEIGGQDAKYTYITNGVPSDYAMNEACSAGTGSFLEEAALETLGVAMEAIGDIAIRGTRPPNFNDQCAAFIASDIKNAIHEGVAHEDIVAGLVYSICMNYANRVKGNRPVGEKVFMQGGVCYNRAVPLAMAALIGKPIVVPPEPGLMGAFGAALEVKKRIADGLLDEDRFDLQALAQREVRYGKSFTCGGGRGKCDRRCRIATIELDGKKFPFGGACNRYYNLRHNLRYDVQSLDQVRRRQKLVFEKYAPPSVRTGVRRGSVGITRSFLVNTYYPFYATFFNELGFDLIVPDAPSAEGIDRREAAFCYPAELAHGFFHRLLTSTPAPDFIFLPHFKAVPTTNGTASSQVCPIVQGETYFLQTTFARELDALRHTGTRLLAPLLDLTHGLETARRPMTTMAMRMGVGRRSARQAFERAVDQQRRCRAEMKAIGSAALADLRKRPDGIGVVIFARPYNGFAPEAHMGIPHKLASRGVLVIPLDFLPIEGEKAKRHMYWGMGQLILQAARLVKRDPQLFATYITNFSCGPDSFLIGYFRSIMGRKPSLTLELDSHTADAGLETRIEAFLDIVTAYRHLNADRPPATQSTHYVPAKTLLTDGQLRVQTSSGAVLPMHDPRVTFIFPSMGRYSSEAMSAVFRGAGFNAVAQSPADENVLKLGRANTSCKECLPLILTTGALLKSSHEKRADEILVYFMPTGLGPCRFGQYYIFMEDLIKRLQIPDVAIFALSGEDAYAGLDSGFNRRGWWAILVSDFIEDIRSMLLANARDTRSALEVFEKEWSDILAALEQGTFAALKTQLARSAVRLKNIALQKAPAEVPTVTLTGEIFVRRDALSRQHLTEQLARKGFAALCSPIAEWVRYTDYLVLKDKVPDPVSKKEKFGLLVKQHYMSRDERAIKKILAQSGLISDAVTQLKSVIKTASPYMSMDLCGEAVLTIGASLAEVAEHTCGVIAIGPFGCMPNRLSEAILSETMTRRAKLNASPDSQELKAVLADIEDLPFLAIESDGSPFPQTINAKLESFCLRARRLHGRMRAAHAK